MSPYDVLNVPPDADAKAIRRAYRRRAKETHPDHGGDVAAFQEAKRASLVLLDPARRAKFDQTGVVEEDAPDNELAEVLVACSQLLDAAMLQCAQENTSPAEIDIIGKMTRLASQAKAEISKNVRGVENHLAASKKLLGRFKVNGKGNLMAAIVTQRIAAQEATIVNLTREAAKMDRVMVFLADYSFEPEPGAPRQPAHGMFNIWQTA